MSASMRTANLVLFCSMASVAPLWHVTLCLGSSSDARCGLVAVTAIAEPKRRRVGGAVGAHRSLRMRARCSSYSLSLTSPCRRMGESAEHGQEAGL